MNQQEWEKITKNVLNIYDNLSSTSKVLEKIKDQLETHELCNKSRESKPAGVKKEGLTMMILGKEVEMVEACWKGYEKKGTKKLFGKTVPNCVKRENVAPDHDGKSSPFGSGYDELEEDLTEY